jgi:CUB domain
MTKNVGGLDHYYVPFDQSTAAGLSIDEEQRRELSSMCNGENPITISNSSGVITSPDYPASYPGSIDCSWRILPHQSDTGAAYTVSVQLFHHYGRK